MVLLYVLYILKATQSHRDIEAVAWRCSVEKVFLKNLQNSQKNTFVGVFRTTPLATTGDKK